MRAEVVSHAPLSCLLPFSRGELGEALERMARRLGAWGPDADLELAIFDDAGMAALNASWLGCPGPANILAFPPAPDAAAGAQSLGLLALGVESVLREAALYGQEEGPYALRLLAHGLCHLLGMEHGADMERLTEEAVAAALEERQYA